MAGTAVCDGGIVIDAVWLPHESGEHAVAETAWARRFLQALQALGPHRAAYGDPIHPRLVEVKTKYDPDNAFHHNKNVRPA